MIVKQTVAGIALILGFFNLVDGNTQVSIVMAVMALMIALDASNDPH